jgi:lipoprotein NlpI
VSTTADRAWRRAALRSGLAVLALAAGLALAAQSESECGTISGNPEASIKACTRAIEFDGLERPELAKAYFVRGLEWAALRNHDRAIADYSTAIELDAKLPDVHYSRALSLSEKGDHERAIADYETAMQLAPKDTKAYLGRAVEWSVTGEYKRAIADYEQVMRLDPKSMDPWFGRGRAHFYAGDFMAAASDFVRAHRMDPSLYTALWLYLARKRADIPGEKTLAQEAGTNGDGDWPASIVGLYLGRTTPEAVQKAAAHPDPTRARDQRCEASFYMAHWHLLRGARENAARLLDEARKACPGTFIEHEGSVAELRRLQQP